MRSSDVNLAGILARARPRDLVMDRSDNLLRLGNERSLNIDKGDRIVQSSCCATESDERRTRKRYRMMCSRLEGGTLDARSQIEMSIESDETRP